MIDKQKIEDFISQFYTHDYGQVYWNKEDGIMYLIGGDGGVVYWTGNNEDLKVGLEEDEIDCLDCDTVEQDFLDFFYKYGVAEVTLEAELSLESWLEMTYTINDLNKYVLIGTMNDLSNILN